MNLQVVTELPLLLNVSLPRSHFVSIHVLIKEFLVHVAPIFPYLERKSNTETGEDGLGPIFSLPFVSLHGTNGRVDVNIKYVTFNTENAILMQKSLKTLDRSVSKSTTLEPLKNVDEKICRDKSKSRELLGGMKYIAGSMGSLTALGQYVDRKTEENDSPAMDLQKQLCKIDKQINDSLSRAEDNLWHSNSALYKAKRTNMYSSINGLANDGSYSVLEGIRGESSTRDRRLSSEDILFPVVSRSYLPPIVSASFEKVSYTSIKALEKEPQRTNTLAKIKRFET
jgi:hypothetical protein